MSVLGALALALFVYSDSDTDDGEGDAESDEGADDDAAAVRPGRAAAGEAFDFLIQVTNIGALALFALLLLYSSPRVKLFVKNMTGHLTFSDSGTLVEVKWRS